MLLAGQLVVSVLVELVELLLVRRALGIFARDEAVVVLVEVLEHRAAVRAGARAGGAARGRRRCAPGSRACRLVALGIRERGCECCGERRCQYRVHVHGESPMEYPRVELQARMQFMCLTEDFR